LSDTTLDISAMMVTVKGSSILACMNSGMSAFGTSRYSKIYGNYLHKIIFVQLLKILPPFLPKTNAHYQLDVVWTVYHLVMYMQSNRYTILLYN
jgi:hypothetical protein